MSSKMRPFRDTIPLEKAVELIAAAVRPIERTERIPLSEADGRVLAADVVSAADVPPFARAAMDGYALRAADTLGASRDQPRTLRRVATVFTGQVSDRAVGSGECIEIATGAPIPNGADAVVMVEETNSDAPDAVRIFAGASPGQNVTPPGSDIARGQQVLTAGTTLTPAKVGAIAALGHPHVTVYARPRVAILSTGNEIVDPGEPLGPAQIYDINRFTLAAIVERNGGIPIAHRAAGDTLDELLRAMDECVDNDVIVSSGGSSVGERDLVVDLLAARGDMIFHGIAVKPGKPTAVGRIGGSLFFGMPGYPTSCLSNAYILLLPALRAIARLPPATRRSIVVHLSQSISSPPKRHQFYTVRVVDGLAVPAFKASGNITSMALADGYIEIPAETEFVAQGTPVEVKLF